MLELSGRWEADVNDVHLLTCFTLSDFFLSVTDSLFSSVFYLQLMRSQKGLIFSRTWL